MMKGPKLLQSFLKMHNKHYFVYKNIQLKNTAGKDQIGFFFNQKVTITENEKFKKSARIFFKQNTWNFEKLIKVVNQNILWY